MAKTILAREQIVDFEDVQAQVLMTDNTRGNVILQITTKNALRAFLVFVGVAWDVTIDTYTTWRVKQDGNVIRQLKDSTVQIAPPEQPDQELVPWIELPQQCTVSVEMDLVAAGANGNGTARLRIYYAPIEPPVSALIE